MLPLTGVSESHIKIMYITEIIIYNLQSNSYKRSMEIKFQVIIIWHLPRYSTNSHSPLDPNPVDTARQLTECCLLEGNIHLKKTSPPFFLPSPTSTTPLAQLIQKDLNSYPLRMFLVTPSFIIGPWPP